MKSSVSNVMSDQIKSVISVMAGALLWPFAAFYAIGFFPIDTTEAQVPEATTIPEVACFIDIDKKSFLIDINYKPTSRYPNKILRVDIDDSFEYMGLTLRKICVINSEKRW